MDLGERIYVINDDLHESQFCESVLHDQGFALQTFPTSSEFLACDISPVGCVIASLNSPSIRCVEIQKELLWREMHLSLIPISTDESAAEAAQLLKHGAVGILQRPYDAQQLLAVVRDGLVKSQHRKAARDRMQDIQNRLSSLTESERNVMNCLMSGTSHKSISLSLDLSLRSVDRRRRTILEKMSVANVQELIRLLTELHIDGSSLTK